ncbi:hypothetical protein ACFWVC_16070 [Streptomyces sp. NPDC058691]|uniref:hypothetical protein n=1 Tax=Streptomyces sp. NPDC058691 TaxID=3346601 RepID=UPI0036581FE8
MGIGYKTSWLAVRDAGPEEVADALGLRHRRSMDWQGGTEVAYRNGVFVARPVAEWTIAHSRIHLLPETDATQPHFPAWLRSLSTRLGDLQFFTTDRIGEFHAWARVDAGELTRAYCYFGQRGDVPLRLGEPTDIERELGVGERGLEEGRHDWQESDWDAWFAAMPNEGHVMRIARSWGICPLDIPDDSVTLPGIHGLPPGVEPAHTP